MLVDPLIPPEARERFLDHLDADVERVGLPVAIVLTTQSHARSAGELADRYGASVGALPPGVETFDLDWFGEQSVWLPGHRTLAFGDALLGDGDGGVRVPVEWVGDDLPRISAALRRLCELPVERLLVAHGEPVLTGGRAALASAVS